MFPWGRRRPSRGLLRARVQLGEFPVLLAAIALRQQRGARWPRQPENLSPAASRLLKEEKRLCLRCSGSVGRSLQQPARSALAQPTLERERPAWPILALGRGGRPVDAARSA